MTALPAARPSIHYVTFSDRVFPGDIAAFALVKVSLEDAITAAEREVHGRAVEAVFKSSPDRPHYVVWLMTNGRVVTSWVDAQRDIVTPLVGSTSLHRLYPGERAEFVAAREARTNLADAVHIAREKSGHKPIAASFERSGRHSAYEIAVVNGSAVRSVWVSSRSPTMASK